MLISSAFTFLVGGHADTMHCPCPAQDLQTGNITDLCTTEINLSRVVAQPHEVRHRF